MTNPYFTNPANIIAGQRATASSVSGDLDLIEAGFNLLPTPTELKDGTLRYAVDTGTVNALVASLPYAPASLADGLFALIKAKNINTGAATLTLNGYNRPLVRPDGNPLLGGEIVQYQIIGVVYNASWNAFALTTLTGYTGAAYVTLPAETGKGGTTLVNDGTNAFWGFSDPALISGLI